MFQIWIDANDPSSNISAFEARSSIRRLVKGFKVHGLQEGDCVCIVAYNNVRGSPPERRVIVSWYEGELLKLKTDLVPGRVAGGCGGVWHCDWCQSHIYSLRTYPPLQSHQRQILDCPIRMLNGRRRSCFSMQHTSRPYFPPMQRQTACAKWQIILANPS